MKRAYIAIGLLAVCILLLAVVHVQSARSSFIPSVREFHTKAINVKQAGAVWLYTPQQDCYLLQVIFAAQTVEGLTKSSVYSVGTNTPLYDNIVSTVKLKNFDQDGQYYSADLTGLQQVIRAGTPVYMRVSVPAIATEKIVRVDILCYHIDQ